MKPPSARGRYIECQDLAGRRGRYDAETVRFRPAAYGLLVRESEILLSRSKFTKLWDFPGGGVEPFEALGEGMAREFEEETGLMVRSGPLIYVAEGYIAMFGHPYHSLRFYFKAEEDPNGQGSEQPDLGELSDLRWWRLDALPNEMHPSDQKAVAQLMAPDKSTGFFSAVL